MELRSVLTEMVIMALAVGFLCGLGGFFLGASFMVEPYAGVIDGFAEWYWDLGAYDEAREAWEAATDIRDASRQVHNYGMYFLIGALLVLVCDTSLWAWRWRKK